MLLQLKHNHDQAQWISLPLVRRIENHPTASGDVPVDPVVIAACGALDPAELENEASTGEGTWASYPVQLLSVC